VRRTGRCSEGSIPDWPEIAAPDRFAQRARAGRLQLRDSSSDIVSPECKCIANLGAATAARATPEQTDLARHLGQSGIEPSEQRPVLPHLQPQLRFCHCRLGLEVLLQLLAAVMRFVPETATASGHGSDPNWIGVVVTPNHPEYPAGTAASAVRLASADFLLRDR